MDTSANGMLTQGARDAVGDPTVVYGDWKELQRQKVVKKIMNTLKRHLPFSEYERLQELEKIAERIEDEIYTVATSLSEYLRKIWLNILTIETRLLNPMSDPMQSKSSAISVNPSVPLDSIAQTGNPNGGDWREEVYKKIKTMKELYLLDLRPSHSASCAIRDPTMESGDWRAQVQAESRQKIANKIMGALKKRLTIFSGNKGLQELQKIAEMLEERIYIFATSQSDYLREISLKMLAVETRSQDPMSDLMHPNSAANSDNPSDRGSEVMQQVNQGQLSIPVPSINIQQMMSQSQNMHSNVGLTGLQSSSSLSSTLPPGSGLQQPTFASIAGQSAKLQKKMSGIQQNQLIGQQYNHSHTHWQQLLKQQMPQPPMLQQQRMTGQQNKLSSRLQPSQQLIGQSTMTNVAGQYFDMQNIQNMPNDKQNQLLQQQRLRPTEGTSGAVGDLTMESGDWRAQLQTDSRERITYQILDTLKRNLPSSGQEKLQELNNIAERVEKVIYTVATSQHEYSRKICFMMLSIQTRLQNPMSDPMGSNSAALYNIVKPSVPLDSIANGGDWLEEVYQKIKALKDLCTLDSTVHNPDGEDWQEEVYEKIKAMKDLYLLQLNDCYQKVVSILQQYDSLPQPKSFQQERLKVFKNVLESYMQFLQTPRHGISPDYKDKMTTYEKHIITIINSSRGRKAVAQQAQL